MNSRGIQFLHTAPLKCLFDKGKTVRILSQLSMSICCYMYVCGFAELPVVKQVNRNRHRDSGRLDFYSEILLTPFERDPHCETCAALQKTPVFPVLQTWYNPTHHLPTEKTQSKYDISDNGKNNTESRVMDETMMSFQKTAHIFVPCVFSGDMTHTVQCGQRAWLKTKTEEMVWK